MLVLVRPKPIVRRMHSVPEARLPAGGADHEQRSEKRSQSPKCTLGQAGENRPKRLEQTRREVRIATGETRNLKVSFPENYGSEKLAVSAA